jgi:hypothetical protein
MKYKSTYSVRVHDIEMAAFESQNYSTYKIEEGKLFKSLRFDLTVTLYIVMVSVKSIFVRSQTSYGIFHLFQPRLYPHTLYLVLQAMYETISCHCYILYIFLFDYPLYFYSIIHSYFSVYQRISIVICTYLYIWCFLLRRQVISNNNFFPIFWQRWRCLKCASYFKRKKKVMKKIKSTEFLLLMIGRYTKIFFCVWYTCRYIRSVSI